MVNTTISPERSLLHMKLSPRLTLGQCYSQNSPRQTACTVSGLTHCILGPFCTKYLHDLFRVISRKQNPFFEEKGVYYKGVSGSQAHWWGWRSKGRTSENTYKAVPQDTPITASAAATLPCQSLFVFILLFIIFTCVKGRARERWSCICWLTPQMPAIAMEWARLKPGAQSYIWASPMGVRGPSTCATICCLPGFISRELAQKRNSQDWNWHFDKGYSGLTCTAKLCRSSY